MIGPYADIAETHISTVFFAGDRAYKLLKPVRMSFLDFSTGDRRLEAVARELQLNRRIAPDVYLGYADVVEAEAVVDRLLVMRRLPAERRSCAFRCRLRRGPSAVARDPPPRRPAGPLARGGRRRG